MPTYSDIAKTLETSTKQDVVELDKSCQKLESKPRESYQPPAKTRGSSDYVRWKYAYFPYLLEIYKMAPEETNMESFFRLLYKASSGEISPYLPGLTENEMRIYKLKERMGRINERHRRS